MDDAGINIHPEYLRVYDLEGYLLETVRPRFQQQGCLSAFDFFCIIIWKANRAKTKVAKRLLTRSKTKTLDEAVLQLTSDLSHQKNPKDRLYELIVHWGFLLPMASAILTILYPDDFTVYDVRVCDTLGNYHKLAETSQFEKLWVGYTQFCADVNRSAPENLSLRDKDRFLWGKSFTEQLQHDIATGFKTGVTQDE
jgi:hypothetical protein